MEPHRLADAATTPPASLHPDDAELMGRALPGGFLLLEPLRDGGVARVYHAEQLALRRSVAVKVLRRELAGDSSWRERFLLEARIIGSLRHPSIIEVVGSGTTPSGLPYLVMELARGQDLGRISRRQPPLSLERIVEVLCQLLGALAEAHAHNVIHRDIKPDNVIVHFSERGQTHVKLIDFGLAFVQRETGLQITRPGLVCGTPEYMAPEQVRGEPLDGRADLYAVGVVLFELLTGRLPFQAASGPALLNLHVREPVPDPNAVSMVRQIPEAFCAVVRRALAKQPEERYRDACDFARALQQALFTVVGPGAAPSSVLPDLVACEACNAHVPDAPYCCECGHELASSGPAASRASALAHPTPITLRDVG